MIDRRAFLAAASAAPAAPTILSRTTVDPVVISAANGNRYTNGGTETCVQRAYRMIAAGGDVLEAVVAGVNIVERDPLDDSVGYGGLPNADGVVQLDASVMHGPKRWAGSVAALEGVRTPSLVAKAVAERTDHHLLVGKGAQDFARELGFAIEPDLNTEHSRALWLEWKRRIDPAHWLDPAKRETAMERARRSMLHDGLLSDDHAWGTINCDGLGPDGSLCGVTTTSGLAWKIPGRVGDSPILGAGLYVDGDVGAAGSTGRGEANLAGCHAFFIVERMRAGLHPKDAAMEALRRTVAWTREKRLLNSKGRPNFQLQFYALDKRGRSAGVSLYGGRSAYAIADRSGARTLPTEPLLDGTPSD